jgi:hypothetical protein
MSGFGDVTNGDRRTQLEQRAEAVRSRLEERLEALDERRDRMVHIASKITKPPVGIVLLGLAGVAGTALLVRKLSSRRPGVGSQWRRALTQSAPRRDGFLAKAVKRAALSFVATAVQRLSTRGLDQLLAEPGARAPAAVPRPRPR